MNILMFLVSWLLKEQQTLQIQKHGSPEEAPLTNSALLCNFTKK